MCDFGLTPPLPHLLVFWAVARSDSIWWSFWVIFHNAYLSGTSWFGVLVSFLWAAKCFIESNPLVYAPAVAYATASGNRNCMICAAVQIDPPSWIQSKLPRPRARDVEYYYAFTSLSTCSYFEVIFLLSLLGRTACAAFLLNLFCG